MSKATSGRALTKKEIRRINENIIKISPRYRLIGGYITKTEDGKCTTTFATEVSHIPYENAAKVGELILDKLDFIDEVQYSGQTVATR